VVGVDGVRWKIHVPARPGRSADLERLRSLEKRKEAAKSRYAMLKVALDNCVHFLRNLESLLD
jgi:hypothetical protein